MMNKMIQFAMRLIHLIDLSICNTYKITTVAEALDTMQALIK